MNTLSVTVRYRPIRIGWCVRSGDFEAFREALRFTFTMWGGKYNPIIPIDDYEYAKSLISLFRVDVLWPVSKGNDIKKFIDRFRHLPNPFFSDELFVPNIHGKREPQIVDIFHPLRRLYDERFKNNHSPDTTITIFEWPAEDPLADVLLATLGGVPSVEITGTDFLGLMKRDLSANTVEISPEEPLPQPAGNVWPVSAFCGAYMNQHYSVQNHWGHPGIYIGNASDFDDLATFWNLRATKTSLMFYDPNHSMRLGSNLTNWFDILRTRPKGRLESDNSIAIWRKESIPQPDLSGFGQGLRVCTASRIGTWNGLNIKAPYMYFSEGSALAAIGKDSTGASQVSFQLPPKPLNEEMNLYDQHLIISVDSGIGLFGNERATLHTPYIPELNEYYGRQCYFEWNRSRVEPDGLGIISEATRHNLSINALDVVDLVKQVFSVAGIDAAPSKPGLIAMRLIQQMGGLQKCRAFKISGVRMLLEEYGPDKSFKHKDAMRIIGRGDKAKGISSISEYKNLFIEPRPNRAELIPNDVFSYLLKKNVYRTGLEFDCPSCRLEFWVSLDDARTEVGCEYCGHRFNVTPHLHGKNIWKFRRSGLFGRNDHQEGAIPVLLTLQQLHAVFHSRELIYTTAMSLKSSTQPAINCETDFIPENAVEPDFFWKFFYR